MSKRLRLAASAALLAFLAWRTDWHHLAAAFAGLRARWWLLAVVLYAVTQVVSAARWRLLARPLGFEAPAARFVGYYYVGMFFNLALPTSVGGDVVRAWYLDGRSGRGTAALVSVLADRVSGLALLLLVAVVALIFCPVALPGWLTWSVAATAGGGALLLGAAPGLATRLSFRFTLQPRARLTQWLGPTPARRLNELFDALEDRREQAEDALALYLFHPWLLLSTGVLSLVIQLANVVVVALIGEALGLTVPLGYYGVLVPVVTLLTLVPVSVNGMGVREGATVVLLAALGVAAAPALGLALLWFAAFAVPSLVGVFPYILGRFQRFEGRSHGQSIRRGPDQGRAGQPRAAA